MQGGLLLKELVEANRTYERRPQIVFIAEKEIVAAALVLNALLQERGRLQFAELVTSVEYMVIGDVGQKIGDLQLRRLLRKGSKSLSQSLLPCKLAKPVGTLQIAGLYLFEYFNRISGKLLV